LGADDKVKFDQYLAAVEEVEQRVGASGGGACASGTEPPDDLAFPDHLDVMHSLIVTAFQCDLTRVISFMLGEAASNQSYDFIGVPGSHHEISHHQNDAKKLAELQVIDNWEVQQFIALNQKLAITIDGDGHLLDSTLAFWSSEISDGNSHTH